MIELMVVVAIMGIVMAIGVPIVYKVRQREALNQTVRDVVEVLSNARARAILQGRMAEVYIHPRDGRMEVAGVIRTKTVEGAPPPGADEPPPPGESGLAAAFSDKVTVEMVDVNLVEYKDAELARVRFYPNGTCDEFTLVLHSDRGEWIKIWLEITTSLANVGPVDAR